MTGWSYGGHFSPSRQDTQAWNKWRRKIKEQPTNPVKKGH